MEDLRTRTLFFCAALAGAIALSMLLRGRRTVHLLFAAFAMDLSLWYASQSLWGIFRADIWGRATAVLTVLLPQFAIYLFQSVVPTEKPETSRLPRVGLMLGVPMFALAISPYHSSAIVLAMVYAYVFGLLFAALVLLSRRGRQSTSKSIRERVRFLVVVGALATTFTLVDFLAFFGLSFPPIGAALAIVFLFVLAQSLTRSRVADLYEMAGRLLVFTTVAFSLAGIFYLCVTLVGKTNTMYYSAVLASFAFLVVFEPLQDEVTKRIHQFFFRERYDLETSVGELRRRLSHVLEVDEMVETVLAGLERSRRATTAALYLRDQEANGFDVAGSIGGTVPRRIEALAARPLLDRLAVHGSFSLEELAREPREQDAPVFTAAAAVLGPLKNAIILAVRGENETEKTVPPQYEVLAFLCIADDRARDAFTPEEVSLLETLAVQMEVTIANSRIYARMKERDRLAALGAMAAGLAHEVKNPLGAIKGAAQLLEESGPNDASSSEFIGIILEEVDRLNHVVGSFLDYARPHAGNAVPIDVNAALKRTVQIMESQQTEGLEFQLELGADVPRAKIDPEQLRQVLINLIQNAIHAMNKRGRITISTSARRGGGRAWAATPAADRIISTRTLEPLRFVEIAVRDTGPGISQKVMKNLFVPFFTTKDQGTGLGLAISQSVVQNAGGTIEVHTNPGAGSTFTIVLPAAEGTLVSTPLPEEVALKAV